MAKNNVIIASLNPNLFTTKRLMEEAAKLNCSPTYLNPYQSLLTQQKTKLQGLYFHRTTGTNYDDFDLLVSLHHEIHGMKVSNPIDSLKLFRAKDQQALFFAQNKLPCIQSLMYRGELNAKVQTEISTLSKNNKFILKMNRGNQGIGVNFLEGEKSLHSILETFSAMKDQKFLIQPYVAHKKEWRIFLIKNEIVACIEKALGKDDFRGNAKRSSGKFLKNIPKDLKTLALKAFNDSGLDYAGIDILLSEKEELLILEINPIPGFEQAEQLSGKNIARELIGSLK